MGKIIIVQNRERLEHLEGVIEKGLQSFYEVGKALLEIRDNQLYEKVRGISTFETYCKGRWGLGRSRAYQLIDSAMVVDNVKNFGQKPPQVESHASILAPLPVKQQREVWQEAVETAPGGKVTAAHVQKVIKEKDVEEKSELKKKVYPFSDAIGFAIMAISQLERIRSEDPKREEAIRRVMDWCRESIIEIGR